MTPFRFMTVFLAAAIVFATVPGTLAEDVQVSRFGESGLEGWETKVFDGETRYSIVRENGEAALRAESDHAASGIYREVSVDLERTPCLHWKWKVAHPLTGLDETTRDGDDYAARVYAIRSGGLAFWQTRTLSYVWAGQQPAETGWPNAFTEKSTMIAVRSGNRGAGEWVMETRNVRGDFQRFAGLDVRRIDAIAIMTDTDNSGTRATAHYADIRFSDSCVR